MTSAQCSLEAAGRRFLDAGTAGPSLRTPAGAPVVGGPFALAVHGARPLAPGLLLRSRATSPTTLPGFGGMLIPGSHALHAHLFVTDEFGVADGLLAVDAVDPAWCGTEWFCQALLFDDAALGGVRLTNGVALEVGAPLLSPFASPTLPLEAFDAPGAEALWMSPTNVNLDGFTDFLVVGSVGGGSYVSGGVFEYRLFVWEGRADGAFVRSPAQPDGLALGDFVGDLALGDVNGDGRDDLFAWQSDGSPALYIAVPTGAFVQTTNLVAPVGPTGAMHLADVDDDGDLDLLAQRRSPLALEVHSNDGSGVFFPGSSVAINDEVTRIRTGEFDGSPGIDVLLATTLSAAQAFANDGTGSFAPGPFLPPIENLSEVCVVDVDADGLDDLVVAKDDEIQYFRANGSGFDPKIASPAFEATDSLVRDLDHDSRPDLVLIGNGKLFPYFGEVDGTFTRGEGLVAPPYEAQLALVDEAVWILSPMLDALVRFDVPGRRRPAESRMDVTGYAPEQATSVDFDGDGDLDLVVACLGHGSLGTAGNQLVPSLFLHANDGSGGFGEATLLFDDPLWEFGRVTALASVDVNRDGRDDLLTSHSTSPVLRVRLGSFGGGFGQPHDVALPRAATRIHVADVDLDGRLDLLLEHGLQPTSLHPSFSVLFGSANGTFSPPETTWDQPLRRVEVADLDADGDLDLVALGAFENDRLRLYEGVGDGRLRPHSNLDLPPSTQVFDLAVADVSGDGLPELFVMTERQLNDELLVLEAAGSWSYAPARIHPMRRGELLLSDFDGDGVTDVTTVDRARKTFLGGRNALVAGAPLFTVSSGDVQRAPLAFDVDGDGDWDLVGLEAEGFLATFLNRTGER